MLNSKFFPLKVVFASVKNPYFKPFIHLVKTSMNSLFFRISTGKELFCKFKMTPAFAQFAKDYLAF